MIGFSVLILLSLLFAWLATAMVVGRASAPGEAAMAYVLSWCALAVVVMEPGTPIWWASWAFGTSAFVDFTANVGRYLRLAGVV